MKTKKLKAGPKAESKIEVEAEVISEVAKAPELKIFAASLVTCRFDHEIIDIQHVPVAIYAADKDEAQVKATRLVLKSYPEKDGWGKHHALVLDTTIPGQVISDVETAELVKLAK